MCVRAQNRKLHKLISKKGLNSNAHVERVINHCTFLLIIYRKPA